LVKDLDSAGPVPVAPDNIPFGLPADLIRRRADIRAAEAQLHADTANIGVAVAQWFPQFSVNGSFGFQGVAIGQMTQWAAQTWSWGPTVNWPILAGGRIDAQIELQKAVLEGDIYAYKNTVLTAMQEVETAIMAFNKEQERREALHEVVDHYQQAYNLSQSLYDNGSTEFINVLTAELSLFSSQNQLATSEANISTDLIAVYKALGGGWSEFPEHDADVVPDNYKPTPTIPPRSLNPVHQ
jgi:outer membrane protein TolC